MDIRTIPWIHYWDIFESWWPLSSSPMLVAEIARKAGM